MEITHNNDLFKNFYSHYTKFTDDLLSYILARQNEKVSQKKLDYLELSLFNTLKLMSDDVQVALDNNDLTFINEQKNKFARLVWHTSMLDQTDFFIEINARLSKILELIDRY